MRFLLPLEKNLLVKATQCEYLYQSRRQTEQPKDDSRLLPIFLRAVWGRGLACARAASPPRSGSAHELLHAINTKSYY